MKEQLEALIKKWKQELAQIERIADEKIERMSWEIAFTKQRKLRQCIKDLENVISAN